MTGRVAEDAAAQPLHREAAACGASLLPEPGVRVPSESGRWGATGERGWVSVPVGATDCPRAGLACWFWRLKEGKDLPAGWTLRKEDDSVLWSWDVRRRAPRVPWPLVPSVSPRPRAGASVGWMRGPETVFLRGPRCAALLGPHVDTLSPGECGRAQLYPPAAREQAGGLAIAGVASTPQQPTVPTCPAVWPVDLGSVLRSHHVPVCSLGPARPLSTHLCPPAWWPSHCCSASPEPGGQRAGLAPSYWKLHPPQLVVLMLSRPWNQLRSFCNC